MCGIVGFLAPGLNHEERLKMLERLLRASQKRGDDATGISFVTNEGLEILKAPLDAIDFCKSDEFKEGTVELPQVVLGHTRNASRVGSGYGVNRTSTGEKLSSPDHNPNNHPFYSEATGISLVHNGFLDRVFWENSAGEDDDSILRPFESTTDSEVALRVLEAFMLADGNQLSILNCIDNLCLNVAGSYAYGIMRAAEPNSIWLVRKDKPLFIAWVPEYSSIIFASEKDIISKALTEVNYEF